MGILFRRNKGTKIAEVTIAELMGEVQELQIQKLAFDTCVNMVGAALGLCEFRTFAKGDETFGSEYYLWNVEPNVNQNNHVFLHKLISQLFTQNEVLIIETRKRNGESGLVVADSFSQSDQYPSKQNEYRDICVEQFQYQKTFYEKDVIHLVMHNADVKLIVDGIAAKYTELIGKFESFYDSNRGNRWKVHVNQMAGVNARDDGETAESKLEKLIKNQFKPFITKGNSLLPEPDGYEYSKIPTATMGVDGSTELRSLTEDIFNYTARAFGIPVVLINGKVEATKDANTRFLTYCIDPIIKQLESEINRKRFGFDQWKNGNRLMIDSSGIIHFDPFEMAAQVEKLIGSGFYKINEVRRVAGQPLIKEEFADTFFMTKNFATAEEIKKGESDNGD